MTVLLSNEILMPRSLLQDPCSADLSAALLVAGLSLAGFPKETRQRVTAGSPSMQSVLSSYLFGEARCWLGQPLQARLGLSSLYRHLLSLSFYLCLSLSALTPHQLISPSALDSGVLLGKNWAKTVLLHSQAWNRANYHSFQHDQLQRTCFWRNFSIAVLTWLVYKEYSYCFWMLNSLGQLLSHSSYLFSMEVSEASSPHFLPPWAWYGQKYPYAQFYILISTDNSSLTIRATIPRGWAWALSQYVLPRHPTTLPAHSDCCLEFSGSKLPQQDCKQGSENSPGNCRGGWLKCLDSDEKDWPCQWAGGNGARG